MEYFHIDEQMELSYEWILMVDSRYKKLIVCDGELPMKRYERVSYWEIASRF